MSAPDKPGSMSPEADSERKDFDRYRGAMQRLNGVLDGDRPEEVVLQECVEAVREVFGADRCFLTYPCDPDAEAVTIPFYSERPNLGLPAFPRTLPVATDAVRRFLAEFVKRQEPLELGGEDATGFGNRILEVHGIRSRLVMPIRPKTGAAWCINMHRCGSGSPWTASDKCLYQDMSARIKSCLEALVLTRTLRQSDAFHNLLTESLPQLLWTSDGRGDVLFANRRMIAFTGIEDIASLGREMPHIHPEDIAKESVRWREIVASGRSYEGEMRIRRKDGVYVWHLVRAEPVRNASGEVEILVGTCTDISEAKHLQEALARSKEELEAIIGGVDEGISAQDATGRLIYSNLKYARISGYASPRELLAAPLSERADRYEMFDEEGKPLDFENLPGRRVLKGEASASLVLRFRDRKQGRELWLNAKSTAVRDADGKVVMAINFSQDITAARAAREELLRSREQFATILAGIADSIIAQNPDGRIVYANEAAAKLLGFATAPDLIAAAHQALDSGAPNTMAFFDEDGQPLPIDKIPSRRARQGIASSPALLRFRMAPKAKERWVIAQAKPIFGAEGKVSLVISMAQDITELKEKEETVRRLQKMESLGKLAGGIAHDFNNLLVTINGYSDMGGKMTEAADPQLHEFFEEIHKSGQRAASLTQQLLAYSRKQIVKPRELNLNALVEDMRKLFARLIGEDIKMETALDAGLPAIKADPSQMEQVLLNLIVNARDAMPKGGALRIETGTFVCEGAYLEERPDARLGKHVFLRVADTGMGMEPAVLERIFDPFFTTKPVGKGTGLGLASVYGIVDQGGGHIKVDSRVGSGSEFTILFPASSGTSGAPNGASTPQSQRTDAQGTVLLVEDEASVLKFASRVLEGKGYRVLTAKDGMDALEKAATLPSLDLLVTDVVMPGMHGPDLIRTLRGKSPELKVLMMSGYIDPDGMEGEEVGRTEFIQKPFGPEAIAVKVGGLLGR